MIFGNWLRTALSYWSNEKELQYVADPHEDPSHATLCLARNQGVQNVGWHRRGTADLVT
jgi:hypothetical protein